MNKLVLISLSISLLIIFYSQERTNQSILKAMSQVMHLVNLLYSIMHQEQLLSKLRMIVTYGFWTEVLLTTLLKTLPCISISFIIEYSRKKRDLYEDFLKSVEILKSMDHYERSKLATVIKE